MLTADQITALAPDAASLKAGRGLATPRKWQTLGCDEHALWGLALGSGSQPYQTRVHLTDFASKCSCPSRKFPCKHAIGLMLIAATQPNDLSEKSAPAWVTEWLESRQAREQKSAEKAVEKAAKPVDEKAAAKRREQRDQRVQEGVTLLQQALIDMTREGLAAPNCRSRETWSSLSKRMIDCQAPRLAGAAQYIGDTLLHHSQVDELLPYEFGRLHALLHCLSHRDQMDELMQAELQQQIGGKSLDAHEKLCQVVEDRWFIAGRSYEERDRLLTSTTWIYGLESKRWAYVLRFSALPQMIVEPWPIGSTIKASMRFTAGLYPQRATEENGSVESTAMPAALLCESWEEMLQRFADALTINPFLHHIAFLCQLRPDATGEFLVDLHGNALPWSYDDAEMLRIEAICAHRPLIMCGTWQGHSIRLLAIEDQGTWHSLTRNIEA